MSFEPVLQLGGKLIKFMNSVKYLGVYLSNNLHDHLDIKRRIKYNFFRWLERIKNVSFKTHCSAYYAGQL